MSALLKRKTFYEERRRKGSAERTTTILSPVRITTKQKRRTSCSPEPSSNLYKARRSRSGSLLAYVTARGTDTTSLTSRFDAVLREIVEARMSIALPIHAVDVLLFYRQLQPLSR